MHVPRVSGGAGWVQLCLLELAVWQLRGFGA